MLAARWILGLLAVVVVLFIVTSNDAGPGDDAGPSRDAVSPPSGNPPALADEPPAEPSAPLEDGQIAITGRVVWEGSREPVSGAEIAVEQGTTVRFRTTSRPDGRFRLVVRLAEIVPSADLPPLLVVRKEGAAILRAEPSGPAPSAGHAAGDLVLRPAWTVRGTVGGEEGEPVPGARIRFCDSSPEEGAPHAAGNFREVGVFEWTESDVNGRFRLDGVSARPISLRVVAPGFVTAWFGGRTRPGGPGLDLHLRRGHDARVRVVDPDGEPVAGARVNLYPDYRFRFAGHYRYCLSLDRSAVTDARGCCRLTGLDERNYRVTAQISGPLGTPVPKDPAPPSGPPPPPGTEDPPRGGAADAPLLAGGPEIVLEIRPDWKSSDNNYEDGPGERAGPPGFSSPFAWVRDGPPRPATRPPDPAPKKEVDETKESPAPSSGTAEEKKPPPGTAWLDVRVRSADGVPMPGVHIRLEGPRSEGRFTEEDGTRSFSLEPGTYRYRVSPMGFGTPSADVEGTLALPGGEVTKLDVGMPSIWSVRVEVRDSLGRPMPRVRLMVLRGDEDEQEWTDERGEKLLFAERGERFSLLALPEGRPTAYLPRLEVPTDGPVVLRVPPEGEITGRVLDPAGDPLFGVRVVARREGIAPLGDETWRGWTDDRGTFRIPGPAFGTYRVTAHHAAFSESSAPADVADAVPLTLRLRPLVRLRGRLVDRRGEGVPGARVRIWRDLGGWMRSDENGSFEIILPAGHEELGINVRHDGFLPVTAKTPVPPDGEVEIRLSRGVELTLDVRCREGRRFDVRFDDESSGARIYAGRGGREEREGGVRCHWPRAPEGTVRVRLTPRGGEAVTLVYRAAEGAKVALEATLPK